MSGPICRSSDWNEISPIWGFARRHASTEILTPYRAATLTGWRLAFVRYYTPNKSSISDEVNGHISLAFRENIFHSA